MSKITVAGNAVIVTSSVKFADILKLQKYAPDSLTLMGGEDGKEPVFKIAAVPGSTGSINQYGVEFGAETRDEQKLATLTMAVSPTAEGDIRELVADKIGAAIVNLNKLEQTLPQALQKVEADRAALMGSIVVLG